MRLAPALLLLVLSGPAFAKAPAADPVCPDAVKPPLFMSPMGEPFRPTPDGADPMKRWFDQADRNQDGKLTVGEMMLDADRFFATLDKDGNGELLPDEVGAYEDDAPEVRLYQLRPEPSTISRADERREQEQMRAAMRDRKRGISGYGGASGAGRYAFLNIPNPVASADDDINRAVSKAEFRAAVAQRFRDLDPTQKKSLALSDLPKTPAQTAANAACLARARGDTAAKKRPPR